MCFNPMVPAPKRYGLICSVQQYSDHFSSLCFYFPSYGISFLTSSPNWTKYSLMNSKSSKLSYLFRLSLNSLIRNTCWPSIIFRSEQSASQIANLRLYAWWGAGERNNEELTRHPGGIFRENSAQHLLVRGREGDHEQQSHLFELQIIHFPN